MHHTIPRLGSRARTILALVIGLGCLLGGFDAAHADTHLVPIDYDEIQTAIDNASDGDTILVEPGLYLENIEFLGKAITVQSVEGPATTTINGTDLTRGDDDGCVIAFVAGEGSDSVLDGFSIRGGVGVKTESTAGNQVYYGGGIYIDESSPTISNCVVFDNWATHGGGIWLGDSEALVENCEIRENEADFGAGIRVVGGNSSVTITDSILEENIGDWGAGIHAGEILTGTDLSESSVTIERCEFLRNEAAFSGGALTILGHGDVRDSLFSENNSALTGGATWFHGIASFERCIFTANTSEVGGAVHNSGIDRALDFNRCIFNDNEAISGGAYAGDIGTTDVTFTNCTLADNTAEDGGAVFLGSDLQDSEHAIGIRNSIIWGCGDEPLVEGEGEFDISYSCVEGGHDGTGNIDEDPEFLDSVAGDFTLEPGSPCIDAGDPEFLDDDGSVVDMGALVFMHSPFLRGDIDSSGDVNALLDVIYFLQWGFAGGAEPTCNDAADVDDSGEVHPLVDTIFLLAWQFTNGEEPAAPGPYDCGSDETLDAVDCIDGSTTCH